jgi:hypothetical protein
VIFQSPEYEDFDFVRKILAEKKLSPLPLEGFASMPHALDQSLRWRRRVERYSWGCVVFATDRQEGRRGTFVVVGDLDIHTGIVKGERRSALPGWYLDLARYFAAEPAQTAIEVPPCLGFHEPDYVCDGGVNPAGVFEVRCGWRARCVALQEHAVAKGKDPREILGTAEPEKIVQITARLETERERAEALYRQSRREREPTANPAASQTLSQFWTRLSTALAPRAFRQTRAEAGAGEFYAVDRSGSSGYLSVYYQPEHGRPVGVASLRVKQDGVTLQLPITPESRLLDEVRVHVVAWRDRVFLSAVKKIPSAVSVEKAVAIVVSAIDVGEIEVPPVPAVERGR